MEWDPDGLPLENTVNNHDDDDEVTKQSCSKTKKRSKARIIRSWWFDKEIAPEKHYRELIMLFTPWRNEQTDLLGTFSSYQECYRVLSKMIEKQMKLQYVQCVMRT